MFEDKQTPQEVTEYEVAREILGRRLGQALAAADATDDPAERERWEAVADEVVRQRKALRVGSEGAASIVAEAKAERTASQQR